MGLVKGNLKTQIKTALEIGKNAPADSDPNSLLEETAEKLADAIDAYIKSATVTIVILPGAAQAGPFPVAGRIQTVPGGIS
mgnify:CR=1 FL=1